MKMQSVCIGLTLLLGTVGCTTGPLYTPAPRPEAGKVRVYFYQDGYSGIWINRFYVNDQHIVSLYDKGYSWTILPEGTYNFSVGQIVAVKKLNFNLSLKSGQDYFIRHRIRRGGASTYFLFSSELAADAREEIVKYHYVESDRIDLK
jgi:Protein of unknown function (DUF2846)